MKRSLLLMALAAATTSMACGGDDARDPAEEAPPAPPPGVSGTAPEPVQGVPSVVLLRRAGDGASEPPSETAVMDQLGLEFTPNQLIVRVGQTIEFVNSESIAHNVHVISMATDSTVFLADMDPDERTQIVLEQEGGYDVTCDVHPGMRALIYATNTPYAVFAEGDGSFLFPDVPPGSYTAEVWSVSPEFRAERSVEVSGPSTELDLTTSS